MEFCKAYGDLLRQEEIRNLDEAELNPCPFCRGEVILKRRGNDTLSFYSVKCPTCNRETFIFNDSETAIKDWNSRTNKI